MRLRQVIEALEKAERDNPDLKDWDVRIARHDDMSAETTTIVENVRITTRGVQIVAGHGPQLHR